MWRPPNTEITLVQLFGGIGTGLAAVLEVGLTVKRYVYLDNSQVSTRVGRHHLHRLIVLYPQQFHPTVIHGYFHVFFVMSHSSVRRTHDTGSGGNGDCGMSMPGPFACENRGQGVGERSLCSSTPWRSHFCGCREHWFICPPLGGCTVLNKYGYT